MIPNTYKFRDLQTLKDDEASHAARKRDASGKAKARYVHRPADPNQSAGAPSSGGKRALTPGGPSGS